MEGNNEKTCANCGSPVKEGAAFCTKCGAAQAAPAEGAAAATPVPPPAPEGAPASPPPAAPGAGVPGAPMPAAAPTAPAKRSKAPMIIGIVGGALVLCAIAVLVLWLTVWSGGGTGADDPLALAEKYIAALEDGNLDAYKECFPPDFFDVEDMPMMEEMGFDIDELLKMTFEVTEYKFDGVGLEVESETANRATVVTTSGTVSVSTIGFSEEFDLEDEPLEFEMEKVDGKWYMVDDPLAMIMGGGMDFDMDFEDLEDIVPEDFDLEDLENLLPEDLEDFENLIPEDLNFEDMSPEELEQMLEDLMEDMPQGDASGV